ncbi:hypothetical protein PIROE2DRAFT_4851 [Piromyces sp. E2]|nr:hypothetical protein PIROE2DRAFT_4851 [Piromyces sp. E2]|eukprot:OUM67678.1 hypothetical protein PIROE2DRAFT_4851 [Piromyces sp. E2]
MKSFYLIALFVAIISNCAFAQYYEEPHFSQDTLTEYEREQAIIQSQMAPVEEQQAPVEQPVPVEQPIPVEQPVAQQPPTEATAPTEKEGSGSKLSGIAITGVAVALIVGVGYKNYRKDMKFKLPEIPKIPGLVTAKEANVTNNNDCVVEMEVLLSETSEAENYSLAKNRAYKCMVSWTPKQSDEIILRRGDLVCVKECFNDGYTLGRNLSTKFDGIFPTCCLCRAEQNVIGSELIRNGKFTAIPKRVSSKKCQERRARRASRGVSFLSSVPVWNKAGFTSIPTN